MLVLIMVTHEEAAAATASTQIVNHVYASGLYYSDQWVTSTLQVKNTGTQRDTFWIRYSVQDKAGTAYNVPATSVKFWIFSSCAQRFHLNSPNKKTER